MALPHYGALKIVTWISGLGSAAIFAFVAESQDLSNNAVKLALIAAVSSLLIAIVTGAIQIILQIISRKDAKEARADAKKSLENQEAMKTSMDGHFTKLLAKSDQQGNELIDKTDRLAHAEGRREGVEVTEDRAGKYLGGNTMSDRPNEPNKPNPPNPPNPPNEPNPRPGDRNPNR